MTDISRRTAVLGAAWAVPVIMAAVAVPLAAASTSGACEPRFHLYRPQDYSDHMNPSNNVAEILVTETAVIITFRRGTDILDINVHKASGNVNIHENRKVKPNECITIPLVNCEDPSFIQVHGNNVHYYGGGVFR